MARYILVCPLCGESEKLQRVSGAFCCNECGHEEELLDMNIEEDFEEFVVDNSK